MFFFVRNRNFTRLVGTTLTVLNLPPQKSAQKVGAVGKELG